MSIQSEIDRISAAKNAIRNAIEAKGVSVSQEVSIDDYASKVDAIQAGGGSWIDAYHTTTKPLSSQNETVMPLIDWHANTAYVTLEYSSTDAYIIGQTVVDGYTWVTSFVYDIKNNTVKIIKPNDFSNASVYSKSENTVIIYLTGDPTAANPSWKYFCVPAYDS